ncbi:MAG: tRNA lysidine(34) synthetase TilS [Patescibacteria group bacterium]
MLSKVEKILKAHVQSGAAIIVGVSGGIDSMVLLDMLVRLREQNNWRVIVAHIDHGIRGRESTADAKFVTLWCKKNKVECRVKTLKLRKNMPNLEEKAREARRIFFESLRAKFKAECVLTAHHADDQLETVFFNFIRGSGPAGLAGMKPFEKPYLKPLLDFSKKEIADYAQSGDIPFRHDRTNDDSRFTRNFLRNEVIPLIAKHRPGFQKSVLRSSMLFRDMELAISTQAAKFTGDYIREFRALPRAVQREVIQLRYRAATHSSKRLSLTRIDEIVDMIERGHGGKKKELPGGLFVKIQNGRFLLHTIPSRTA